MHVVPNDIENADLGPECAALRTRLMNHPLYEEVSSIQRIRAFMEQHVFAVWDFMTLLKRLQQIVTRVDLPWIPPQNSELARFVNEIVVAEESDDDGRGGYASHFELYCDAMRECGADTAPVELLVKQVRAGSDALLVLKNLEILPTTAAFVTGNLQVAASGAPHEIAAAFCLGREDVIPEMFSRLLPRLQSEGHGSERLLYYLNRHIEIDGDQHGPLSQRLLLQLIADDPRRKREAASAAANALELRIQLWDGVLERIRSLPA